MLRQSAEGYGRDYLTLAEEMEEREHHYGLVLDMLDGLAKGYSVSEILWSTHEGLWWPASYAWRDPRLFVHDIRTKSEIRLAADGLIEGPPLERGRFIVHAPKLKTGTPPRGGLARPASHS